MTNEKNKVEALLFAVAKRIHIDEISKITGIRTEDKIKKVLSELKADYDSKGASMELRDEGEGYWKLTVKDHYMPIVNKVVSQTELDRPLIETLAVIAWKYPVVQSDVVKIRHNKAYDHLRVLNEMGFITRQKFGRTNKLTLTQKFFEYFDLPSEEQAREVFKNVVPKYVQEKIEKTEGEIDEAERTIEEYNKLKEEEKKAEKDKAEKEEVNKEPEGLLEPEEIKEELFELQDKEDKELEKIEEDLKDMEQEETKEEYSVSEQTKNINQEKTN